MRCGGMSLSLDLCMLGMVNDGSEGDMERKWSYYGNENEGCDA
jgi:hypothetical protein